MQLLCKSHLQKQPEKSSAEISEMILFCFLTCKVILAVGRPYFVFCTAGRCSSSYNSQRRVSNPLHSINQHLTGKGLIASGLNFVIMWSNFALLGEKHLLVINPLPLALESLNLLTDQYLSFRVSVRIGPF